MHNAMLHQIPSTIFSNIKSLEYLQIVEPTQNFTSNLFLGLENLKELRIRGSLRRNDSVPPSHDNTMTIPHDFLHDS